jgi:branched-chain amino acid transport system ATP-binding protein
MSALLEIKNIETFYTLIYALRGVSLTVEEGTITAVLGNNGAGKSTVLKTVMGLLDDQPDKGTIEFMGKRIDGKDPEVIVRRGISYVPEGREVFEELSVRENLLMGAYIRRDRAGIKKDFDRIYRYFPVLKQRSDQWAGTLSGGEQQMLAIGRALMAQPKILLLDEPLLGLSPLMQTLLMRATREIRDERNITIIVTEQYARPVFPIVDYAFILENGSAVLEGKRETLMDNPDVRSAYFGM